MARNYRKEYDNYQGKSRQKKRRAQRNKTRRKAIREGRAALGDGVDMHHPSNNPANPKAVKTTKKVNRSFPRNKSAGHK